MPRQELNSLTLGVEEEFFVVDARTFQLANASPSLVPEGDTERLKQELFECIVETTTPIVRHPRDVLSSLVEGRRRLALACERHGLRPLAVGCYPGPVTITPRVAATPYYRGVAERLGDSLADQLVCGLHVHIGLPSTRRTLNALEGVIPWLPSILALGANSPQLDRRDSQSLSLRASRLAKLAGDPLPPVAGAEPRAPFLSKDEPGWWDIRLNTRYGTLEIRVIDQPTDVRRSASFVALVHAIALAADRTQNAVADRVSYLVARDAALRGSWSRKTLARHVEPATTETGTWPMIAALLESECEAERQLRIAHEGGVTALLEDIADRTVR